MKKDVIKHEYVGKYAVVCSMGKKLPVKLLSVDSLRISWQILGTKNINNSPYDPIQEVVFYNTPEEAIEESKT